MEGDPVGGYEPRSAWARDIAVAGDIAELKAALPSLKGAVDQTNAMLREHVSEQRMENSQLKTDVSARFDKLEAKQLVVDARVSALELLHAKEDAVRAKDSARAGWAHKIFGGAITGGIMAAGAAIWSFIQQARHPVAALAVSGTLLCATGADAATYYVACGTGSNSAAGSSAAPWATITYASSKVVAGDTVIVKPGTCVESVRAQVSGQPASPITYRAETRGAAKIVPPANNTAEAAWEQGGSNVVVDGFEIDGSAHQSGARWKRGIEVLGQQVTVAGNIVHDIGRLAACTDAGYGIGAPEEAGYVTIHANTVRSVGNPNCGAPIEMTLEKTWTATASTADYTALSPAGSEFFTAQTPWGAYDMGAGDVFEAKTFVGSNGYIRHQIITGPLRTGNGLPKGAPNVTFGDHFDLRPAVRPLGNGVWSNAISDLKVSSVGTATASSTGAYARAIQIHGFRTAYTGSAWSEVSSTDGDTYDIQIRYKTSGSFPLYGGGSDVFRERKQIGNHTWDIYRTEGGWASDLGIGFVLTSNVESISNVDVKAILDYALADSNARYSRSDTGIYVRGVQTWLEPISGTIDATIEGMTVTYNGTTYGVAP